MLWGAAQGGALELRQDENGGARLRGRFPYNAEAILGDGPGGRRIEVIAARAFAARIEAGEEIHLLSGHDYQKPLASTTAGTLTLRDGETGLELEARIDPGTTWARDFLEAFASRQTVSGSRRRAAICAARSPRLICSS